jgi:hypothetical protein
MAFTFDWGSIEKYTFQKPVDKLSSFFISMVKPCFKNLYVALRTSMGSYSAIKDIKVRLSCSADFHFMSGTIGV